MGKNKRQASEPWARQPSIWDIPRTASDRRAEAWQGVREGGRTFEDTAEDDTAVDEVCEDEVHSDLKEQILGEGNEIQKSNILGANSSR